jgi:hypothetical protein
VSAGLSLLHHCNVCGDFVSLCSSILPRWIYDGIGTGTSVLFPLIFEFVAGAGVYLEVGLDRRDVMTALAFK